jgi:tetratricopeptide (TPR) repeat protein
VPRAESPGQGRQRLNSWKEVARYFQRDERTVKRWEEARGLPIRRMPGEARSKVYAYVDELAAWLATSDGPAGGRSASGARRRLIWGGVGLTAVALAAAGLLLGLEGFRRPGPAAERLSSKDPVAVEAYHEAAHDWSLRSAASLQRARLEYLQAIGRDPRFAEAYAGLGQTYLLLREYADMPDPEAYEKARSAVTKALQLDPQQADAHSALGFIEFYRDWRPRAAEVELDRAIRLAPYNPTPHIWLANILKVEGRTGAALKELDKAQVLAPASTAVMITRGEVLVAQGDMAAGKAILRHVEDLEPQQMWPHARLAHLALIDRDVSGFLSEERLAAVARGDAQSLAIVEAGEGARAQGDAAALSAILNAQDRYARQGGGSLYDLACTAAIRGDAVSAVRLLQQADRQRETDVLGLFSDPCFQNLRNAPGLAAIRRQVLGA